jgi:uncharacterized protein (TIGR02284 family)
MAVFTAAQALEMALQIEQNGRAFYQAAAQKVQDPEVEELLQELADWEEQHYEHFKSMTERVGDPPPPSGPWADEYDLYLQATLNNALFEGEDKAAALVDELEEEEDVLRMALGFEKDTLLFYYDLWRLMPETEQEIVDRILQEEKSHVMRLSNLLRSGQTEL